MVIIHLLSGMHPQAKLPMICLRCEYYPQPTGWVESNPVVFCYTWEIASQPEKI